MATELEILSAFLRMTLDFEGDEFARAVSILLAEHHEPAACLLYEADVSGNLVVQEAFGWSEEIARECLPTNIFDASPLALAIRASLPEMLTREDLFQAPHNPHPNFLFDCIQHVPIRPLGFSLGGFLIALPVPRKIPENLCSALAVAGFARLARLSASGREAA